MLHAKQFRGSHSGLAIASVFEEMLATWAIPKSYILIVLLTMVRQFTVKSNQIKSLLLSHHHSTSALVSEILMSVLQTVQKNNRQFTYASAKKKKKKNNNRQFTYGQTVQKTALEHLQCSRQCKKKQQQFTYGQYIFTDCTEDNVQNTHTYTQYT